MDVFDMGGVAQIVAKQQVVGLDVERIPVGDAPLRPVVFGEVVNVFGIRLFRIAHPDPDQAQAFGRRIALHAGVGRDDLLPRHVDAGAGPVEHQPVIAALDPVVDQAPLGQRKQPMRAAVAQRHRRTVAGPV